MKLFQLLFGSALLFAFCFEVFLLLRRRGPKPFLFVRMVVWMTASITIFMPETFGLAANLLGIDRGADFVSYLFILVMTAVTFYFYSRYDRLSRQLTEVVRHIAIKEAVPPEKATE